MSSASSAIGRSMDRYREALSGIHVISKYVVRGKRAKAEGFLSKTETWIMRYARNAVFFVMIHVDSCRNTKLSIDQGKQRNWGFLRKTKRTWMMRYASLARSAVIFVFIHDCPFESVCMSLFTCGTLRSARRMTQLSSCSLYELNRFLTPVDVCRVSIVHVWYDLICL